MDIASNALLYAASVLTNKLQELSEKYEEEEEETDNHPTPDRDMQIYYLCDPDEPGVVRYVGQSNKPTKRLNDHIWQAYPLTDKDEWLRSLMLRELRPVQMIEQAYYTQQEVDDRERALIIRLANLGHPLTNVTHNPNARKRKR